MEYILHSAVLLDPPQMPRFFPGTGLHTPPQ